jgi:hypothetical protein
MTDVNAEFFAEISQVAVDGTGSVVGLDVFFGVKPVYFQKPPECFGQVEARTGALLVSLYGGTAACGRDGRAWFASSSSRQGLG